MLEIKLNGERFGTEVERLQTFFGQYFVRSRINCYHSISQGWFPRRHSVNGIYWGTGIFLSRKGFFTL